MTKPLNPADPAVIAALVDKLLAQAKAPTPTPRPPRVSQRESPAKNTPTPAPSKGAPMKNTKPTTYTAKAKTFARTRRTPTPKPAPKPSSWIELAEGANLSMSMPYAPPKFSHPTTPARSAHDLPKDSTAPCFTCGGECDSKEDRWGPHRRHRDCLPLTQAWQRLHAAAVWFAVPDVTENEAWCAADTFYVPEFSDTHPSAVYGKADADRSPWSHVEMRSVVRAIMEARQALSEVDAPKACELGVCGWCGVAKSSDWSDYGHVRSDNTKAPLCAVCGPIFDVLPGDYVAARWDDQRGGLAESLTGVPADLLETFPHGLRAHAETGGGTGEPWSHLRAEAVEAFKWERWARYNGVHAPPEHKAEALARARALEADKEARTIATQTADRFGFTGDSSTDKESTDG